MPKIEIKVDKPEPSDIKQRSPLPVPRQHRPSSAEQDRPKSPGGRPPSPIPAPRPGRPVSAGTSASEEQSRPKPVPRNKNPNFRSFPVPDKHNDENEASTQEISAVAQRRGSFDPNGPENQKPVVPLKRPDVPGKRPHSDVPSGKPMVKPGADRRVTPLKRPEVPVKRSHSDVTPPPKPDTDKAKRPSLPPTAENPSTDGPVTNLKRPEVPVKRSHSDVTPPPKPGKDKAKRPLLPPTLEDPTNENMKKPLPAGRELKRPVVPPVNEKSKKPILPPGKAGKKPLLPPEKQRKPLLAPKTENEDENSERPLTVSERRRLLEQQGQRWKKLMIGILFKCYIFNNCRMSIDVYA